MRRRAFSITTVQRLLPDIGPEEVTMTTPTEAARDDLVARMGHIALEFARNLPKPWHELNERDQALRLQKLEEACAEAAGDMVDYVASRGHPHARISLDQVTFKSTGAKMTALTSKHHPKIHDLADLAGHDVILVLTDANQFLETEAFPVEDGDQGELGLEEGDSDASEDVEPFELGDIVMLEGGERATVVELQHQPGAVAEALVEYEYDGETVQRWLEVTNLTASAA